MIYWLTGQPGAGKTTLARALKTALDTRGYPTVHLDNDEWRVISNNQDYSEAGRRKNLRAVMTFARKLHNDGSWVICSFVSPYRDVRDEFKQSNDVVEVYLHTNDIRGRENFFAEGYEPPITKFVDIDSSLLSVDESVQKVFSQHPLPDERYIHQKVSGNGYAMFIGRWQPWHAGHAWLVHQALNRGKRALICIRDMPTDEQNPWTAEQVKANIEAAADIAPLVNAGQVRVMIIPDIESVNFGRGVGYSIIEHFPPTSIKAISATKIRTGIKA